VSRQKVGGSGKLGWLVFILESLTQQFDSADVSLCAAAL
jgi:hypothetical protein